MGYFRQMSCHSIEVLSLFPSFFMSPRREHNATRGCDEKHWYMGCLILMACHYIYITSLSSRSIRSLRGPWKEECHNKKSIMQCWQHWHMGFLWHIIIYHAIIKMLCVCLIVFFSGPWEDPERRSVRKHILLTSTKI